MNTTVAELMLLVGVAALKKKTVVGDRPTAHDRPRLAYLFEEAVPTPPQGGLGG